MNRSRSFAALFDKLSRIERQSRPKYKSAFPDWFIRRTLHVPNLIIRLGTCKVRHLSGPYVPSPFSFLFPSSSTILLVSLLNFSYSLLHNFIISPPQCFYSLLPHNFIILPSHSWIPSFSTILIFPTSSLFLNSLCLNFIIFPPRSFLFSSPSKIFIIFPP